VHAKARVQPSYSLDLRYDNRAVLTTRDVFERPVFQQWSLTQQNTLLVGNSEYSFSQTGIETNLGSTTCSKTEDAFIPDDFQKQNPTYQCGLEYYTFHPDRSLYVDGVLVDQWSRDVNAYSFTDEVFYLDTPEIMHRFWFRHACTHFSGPILVPITVDPIGVYDCTLGSITSTLEVRDDGVAQQHYVSVDVNTRPYEWYISEKTTLRFGASEFFFTDFGLESSFGETCIAQ